MLRFTNIIEELDPYRHRVCTTRTIRIKEKEKRETLVVVNLDKIISMLA